MIALALELFGLDSPYVYADWLTSALSIARLVYTWVDIRGGPTPVTSYTSTRDSDCQQRFLDFHPAGFRLGGIYTCHRHLSS